MQYALNLYSDLCQLFLNKTGKIMNHDTYLEENQLQVDYRSTMKGETRKFLEDVSECHHDLGVGKAFYSFFSFCQTTNVY